MMQDPDEKSPMTVSPIEHKHESPIEEDCSGFERASQEIERASQEIERVNTCSRASTVLPGRVIMTDEIF